MKTRLRNNRLGRKIVPSPMKLKRKQDVFRPCLEALASQPDLDVVSGATPTLSDTNIDPVHLTEVLGESESARESGQLPRTAHEELWGGLPSNPLFFSADLAESPRQEAKWDSLSDSASQTKSIWLGSSAAFFSLLGLPHFYRQSDAAKKPAPILPRPSPRRPFPVGG
jgi:hypothetical protein